MMAIVNRLREPSTWAAIGVAGAAAGIHHPSGWWQALSQLGVAVCVVLGIVLRERGS